MNDLVWEKIIETFREHTKSLKNEDQYFYFILESFQYLYME